LCRDSFLVDLSGSLQETYFFMNGFKIAISPTLPGIIYL
jgi:hypothetical protein